MQRIHKLFLEPRNDVLIVFIAAEIVKWKHRDRANAAIATWLPDIAKQPAANNGGDNNSDYDRSNQYPEPPTISDAIYSNDSIVISYVRLVEANLVIEPIAPTREGLDISIRSLAIAKMAPKL